MPFTNKGALTIWESFWNGAGKPANLYIALVTSATAPTVDTNTMSQLTEIAAGNGYTSGGNSLSFNTTDFPSLTENDTDDRAEVDVKANVFTASGGNLPASGSGARYAVLTDANATVADREILGWVDLGSDCTVSDGQSLTINAFELRASTV